MCSSSAVVNDWRMFPPGFHELDQTLLALLRRRRTGGTPAHPWPPFPPRPRLAPVSHPPPPALHARRQTMDCGRKRLLLPCSTYLQEKTWEEQPRKSKGLSEHGIPTSNSHTTPHCLHFTAQLSHRKLGLSCVYFGDHITTDYNMYYATYCIFFSLFLTRAR